MLGREPSRFGVLATASGQRGHSRAALAELGQPDLDPERGASAGCRRRAPARRDRARPRGDARVVVMDEPTSSLPRADAERLFAVIGRLRARGVAVVYISHFLEEVAAVADRFTVLRDGRTVGSRDASPTRRIDQLDRADGGPHGRRAAFRAVRARAAGEVVLELEAQASAGTRCRRRPPSRCGAARSSASPGSSAPAAPSCCARSSGSTRSRRARAA